MVATKWIHEFVLEQIVAAIIIATIIYFSSIKIKIHMDTKINLA